MTLNHESLFAQSVLNGMRASARRQAANNSSKLGVPQHLPLLSWIQLWSCPEKKPSLLSHIMNQFCYDADMEGRRMEMTMVRMNTSV